MPFIRHARAIFSLKLSSTLDLALRCDAGVSELRHIYNDFVAMKFNM